MWRAVWLCLALSALGHGEEPPTVVVSQGHLRGTLLKSRGGREFSAFQGIPYASPPIGPLRFHKPVPAGSWEGVRNATQPGNLCIQANYTSKGLVYGDEDCLYLNVFTHKASSESKTPVLVFIHGGAFDAGSGNFYRPDFWMDRDIILVTINYRLGALGFISFEDKVLPGNNGLKDQTLALRWVKDNIGQFGGDSGAVTICGESAGAASVHLLMLSPLSKDLFQQGIAQSGSAYCPWVSHAPGQLRAKSERFAAEFGCNFESTRATIDCLRDMPAYVLVEVTNSLFEWPNDRGIVFTPAIEPPDVEDAFLTVDPWTLSSDKPWLTGVTTAEGSFKSYELTKENIIELNEDFEMIAPAILLFRTTADDPVRTALTIKKYYFLSSDIKPDDMETLTNMYSDAFFVYPALESLRRHRGRKYLYYFDYRGVNSMEPACSGVNHFDDMQYFFPMNQFYQNFNTSAEDNIMSQKLIDLWVNFITHGRPTLDTSDVSWEEATSGAEYLHIKKDGFLMEKDLFKERDHFWSSLPYREKYLSGGGNSKDEL